MFCLLFSVKKGSNTSRHAQLGPLVGGQWDAAQNYNFWQKRSKHISKLSNSWFVRECHNDIVHQWKYGKIVVAGTGELLKVSMFGKKKDDVLAVHWNHRMFYCPVCQVDICWVSFSLEWYVMRNLYLTFVQIKTVLISLIEYWGS